MIAMIIAIVEKGMHDNRDGWIIIHWIDISNDELNYYYGKLGKWGINDQWWGLWIKYKMHIELK